MLQIEMRISDDSRPDGTFKGTIEVGEPGQPVDRDTASDAGFNLFNQLYPSQPGDPSTAIINLIPAVEGGAI